MQKNGSDLIAVSSAAALRRSHLPQRLALVGDTQAALLTQLQAFMESGEREAETAVLSPSPLVFVFSGQGTQWLGMGQTLYAQEPVFRATLDACDAILQPIAGWSLLAELNAPPETSRLDDTLVAQVAIFAMQVALAALWHSWGIIPAAIVGQSLGEVAAAHAAGALSLEDALRVVFHRSRVMQQVEGKG
ncbi:MAG: acyltransferase domain-containing protein [Chloroflexi bacterium]|nr:acyltransferase domain-containing protein [Chloroflexota bacterium]